MSSPQVFPLHSLLRLREQIVDQHKQQLAAAIEGLGQTQAALSQAQTALLACQQQIADVRQTLGHAERLGELAACQRYRERLEALREKREQQLAAAQKAHSQQEHAVEKEREALGRARGELKAVEQAQHKWNEGQRRLAEKRAEQELEDLLCGRRR